MNVNELIIELQKLQHKGYGENKVAVWDEDNRVAKHIMGIDNYLNSEGYVVIDVSVLPV